MKQLEIVIYTYKSHLTEADVRQLAKTFVERGQVPGVIAQYERLDGRGGFVVKERTPDAEGDATYELTLAYGVYMEFESVTVTPIDDAVPTILKLFG